MLTSLLIDDLTNPMDGGRIAAQEKAFAWLNRSADPDVAAEEDVEQMEAALASKYNVTDDDVPDDEFVVVSGIGPIVDPLLAAD